MDYVRYRFVGNKPIIDGDYKEKYTYMPLINNNYGNRGDYLWNSNGKSLEDIQQKRKYNKIGKRVMKFYHPSMEYKNYINELGNIDSIDDSKLIEMSLSFDKEYTMNQIQKMLPKDVILNWYWINTLNENDTKTESKVIFDEYDVYGIKVYDFILILVGIMFLYQFLNKKIDGLRDS
ncbi:anti sigma factor C-terminal domain-containing protein [Clostridium cadaveris]|nr:anti sigma factor C-terminal domain-containing protein [Clostridium cadaveris]MDM8313292.1 anti sigma factor C-terminal domain-containing protein [Clostridium cadaveris]